MKVFLDGMGRRDVDRQRLKMMHDFVYLIKLIMPKYIHQSNKHILDLYLNYIYAASFIRLSNNLQLYHVWKVMCQGLHPLFDLYCFIIK